MTNILWAYDSENGNIAPLPASPFLLPAVLIAGLYGCVKALQPEEVVLGNAPAIDPEEYSQNQAIYWRLSSKGFENFSEDDWIQWGEIRYPSWHRNKSAPPWAY